MRLSTKSWHYWLYERNYEVDPTNLCPYFWKVILALVVLPITFWTYVLNRRSGFYITPVTIGERVAIGIIGPMALVALIAAGYGTSEEMGWGWVVYLVDWGPLGALLAGAAIFALVALTILVIAVLFSGAVFGYEEYQNRKRYREPKNPSLFRAKMKAKIEGICPRIEWEDK